MPSTKSGQFLTNLCAVGNVIGVVSVALELGCGSGVAVVTALAVADEIFTTTLRRRYEHSTIN